VPLCSIEGGHIGLTIVPTLGPYSLDHEIAVAARFRGNEKYKRWYWKASKVICVYLLYYKTCIKIGTSSLENAVIRMYQQAPLFAKVAVVVELRKDVFSEEIENSIVKSLKKRYEIDILTRSPSIKEIVQVWRKVSQVSSSESDVLMNMVKSAKDYINGLCEEIWAHVCENFGDPLYEPGLHWFVPKLPTEEIPEPTEKLGNEMVKLRALPNGLFKVSLEKQLTLDGDQAKHVATYSVLKEYEFKVMNVGE